MPSYYDSTKTKPGLAEIKYKKGGKIKKMAHGGALKKYSLGQISERERGLQRQRDAAPTGRAIRRSDPEKRESVRRRAAEAAAKRRGGSRKKKAILKEMSKGISSFKKLQEKRNKAPKGSALGQVSERELQLMAEGKIPVKMSKGGKLKVTGMGAATRGGNFTRNG